MSVSRPARCLFLAPTNPLVRPRLHCQKFHTSPSLSDRERRRFKPKNIKAKDMGLIQVSKRANKHFKPYTEEEKRALAKKFTPEQMKAIEMGEEAIDPRDLERRGSIRNDWGSLPYFDDLSTLQATIDKTQFFEDPMDPDARMMTPDEYHEEKGRVWEQYKEEIKDRAPFDKTKPEVAIPFIRTDEQVLEDRASMTMGRFGPVPARLSRSYLAPGLPRTFLDVKGRPEKEEKKKNDEDDEDKEADPRDPDGAYNKLIKSSGLSLDEILDFKMKILVRHRVVNQTRLGKIASIYCLACAGDGKGRLGIGEAKGQEPEDTQNNARIAAIRAMQPIPRYENRTIYGDIEAKVSASVVQMMARPPGFGLRCQSLIFEMARAAGIQDLSAKVPRSRNKMNTVKAAYYALLKQKLPDEIARGRGKKLVDVRKVYYGGRV